MNGIYRTKNNFSFLEWRENDVRFQQEEFIPFLFSKLDTKYSEVKEISITDLDHNEDCEGYRYSNLKMLKVKLETIGGKTDLQIKLPTPGPDDIFIINRNPYILINQYVDDLFYFYNRDIFTISFRINHATGGWVPFKGSQARAQKQIPLILVCKALGILDDYFPNATFQTTVPENSKVSEDKVRRNSEKFVWKVEDNLYFVSDNIPQLNNSRKLILTSIRLMQKFKLDSVTELSKVKKVVEAQTPFDYSYEYEFVHGYSDLPTLYRNIFEKYNNEEYHKFDEIHLDFKRVKYYQQILGPLAAKIKNIRNIFDKAKNLTTDISWKQRIPANIMTKALKKYKYLQYLELNPFSEIDYKYKLTTPLENVPKYMRSTAYSGVYNVCPLNTPDNAKIGIVQSLASDVQLTDHGKFEEVVTII